MALFYQQRLWSRHRERISSPRRRQKRALNARLLRSSTVSVVSANVSYLGYICSGLARAVRDPYHSVAGLVFALCRVSRNWTVADGYFSALGIFFFSGFQSTGDGFTAVASVTLGPQRRGKKQWVELVVERERGRETQWSGGGRCIRTAHPGISAWFSLSFASLPLIKWFCFSGLKEKPSIWL